MAFAPVVLFFKVGRRFLTPLKDSSDDVGKADIFRS